MSRQPRHRTRQTTTAGPRPDYCQCPAGWPKLIGDWTTGTADWPELWRRHHPICGKPESAVDWTTWGKRRG